MRARIAALIKNVDAGRSEETPEQLNTPGKRAIFNNLMPEGSTGKTGDPTVRYGKEEQAKMVDRAMQIDDTIKRIRPDGWRGIQAREQVIKAALFDIIKDKAEVERIFLIIKAQKEY